ncbi:MAG: efflux RND transporter periplasmic adaptor subunit [Candidatus Rokuibacteriota bacterium]
MTPVVQRDVTIHGEWIGTTTGYVDAQIRALVSGYLMSQHYKEGSLVRKGELLFQIDPRPYQAALDEARAKLKQAQSEVEQARAEVKQAESGVDEANALVDQGQADVTRAEANQRRTELDVDRYTPLAQDGSVSQQELDDAIQNNLANKAAVVAAKGNVVRARAGVVTAKANVARKEANVARALADVERAQAGIEQTALNLSFASVSSPIDGIAGIRAANIGDVVGRDQNTLLTTVSQVDPLYVEFPIAEQEFLKVAKAWEAATQGTGEKIALELILSDGSVYRHPGQLDIVGRGVDVTTGTLRIRGLFPNPGNLMRPGQYAKIRAPLDVRRGALLVPQKAVQQLQGIYQLAVVLPDNTVQFRTVKVGPRVGPLWIIDDGLRPGEQVVVDGLQRVKAAETVRPKLVP